MKTELLYEFKVLAEIGNFQEAADKLFLSQSALSKHIMIMEDELGFALMEHKRNKFTLTPAGLDFLPYAQSMCDLWNNCTKSLMGRSKNILLDIGVSHLSDIENDLFSKAVSDYSDQYPNSMVRTSVIKGNENVENLLLKDDSHSPYCCLISKRLSTDKNRFSSAYIDSQILYTSPIMILSRADHPQAGKEFNLDDFGTYSLVALSFYSIQNMLTSRVFRDSKVRAFFAHTVTSMQSVFEFVEKHNCIYMATDPLDPARIPEGLVLTPLSNKVSVETYVAYTQDFEKPNEKEFLNCLIKRFQG